MFTNIQVHLAGDIKVQAMCNSRATVKTYPVIFVCMNTGFMNLGLMHAYDTAAFLLQYEHHCAVRGWPKFKHSDPVSQIKKATYYLADSTNKTQLNITMIVEVVARRGTT